MKQNVRVDGIVGSVIIVYSIKTIQIYSGAIGAWILS